MGTKSGGRGGGGEGEIIQVQGGHIVRSTGRKDRHSKVYTAKGPRDRRVRLSAHTAIQFYDVQDRLGYDRPSKAVDWLIKKAQSSIDKLAQLPPWHPPANTNEGLELEMEQENEEEQSAAVTAESDYSSSFHLQNSGGGGGSGNHPTASFLHPDGIADTMKSFFPTSSSTNLSMNFQSYPPDLISRSSANQSQDLGLSLHSFVDHPQSGHDGGNHHQGLFQAGSGGPVGYETNFHDWSNETSTENRGGAFGFSNHNPNQLAAAAAQHAMMAQDGSSTAFAASSSSSQRGPLQSNGFFGRAWNDVVPMGTENHHNHQHHNQQHQRAYEFHQSVLFGSRFLGSSDGIHNQGFRIPARIHGGEQDGGCGDRAGSSSSPGGRSAEH